MKPSPAKTVPVAVAAAAMVVADAAAAAAATVVAVAAVAAAAVAAGIDPNQNSFRSLKSNATANNAVAFFFSPDDADRGPQIRIPADAPAATHRLLLLFLPPVSWCGLLVERVSI